MIGTSHELELWNYPPTQHNYVLDTLPARVFMRIWLRFNVSGNGASERLNNNTVNYSIIIGLAAGERSERGSPVDGDELLGRALLSGRRHLPVKDRSESHVHWVCVCAVTFHTILESWSCIFRATQQWCILVLTGLTTLFCWFIPVTIYYYYVLCFYSPVRIFEGS